jgi:hypothetical protein
MRIRSYFLIAGAVLLSLMVARVGFVLVERWRYSLSRPVFAAGFPAIQNWKTLKIKLVRTFCLGECPDYSVEIDGDGTVHYLGREHVFVPGRHQTHISPVAVQALFRKFQQAAFFSTFDHYYGGGSDVPGYIVTISFDGHSKAVRDYVGRAAHMPSEITDLETAIDDAANTKLWVKGDGDVFAALVAEHWDFHVSDDEHSHVLENTGHRRDAVLVKKLVAAGMNGAIVDRALYMTPKPYEPVPLR